MRRHRPGAWIGAASSVVAGLTALWSSAVRALRLLPRPALRQQGRLVDEARRRRDLRQPRLLVRRRCGALGDQRRRRTGLGLHHGRADRSWRRSERGVRHQIRLRLHRIARGLCRLTCRFIVASAVRSRGRRSARCQLAALLGREGLVGLPARLPFFLGELANLLEVQSRLATLSRRQLDPLGHAGRHALLFRGRQARITHRDLEPLLLVRLVDGRPVALQGLESRTLRRGEFLPAGAALGRAADGG